MKHCIYSNKTEPEVFFLSEEHIFPAGIGGIQKLPMEYVSHNCNNDFSKLELQFMRNSLIALPRQFFGPGKRGSLKPKDATQGMISIIETDEDNISLGFLSLGVPYHISQLIIDITGDVQFISEKSSEDISNQTSKFLENLGKFKGIYTLFEDTRLKQSEFILGLHQGRWYVALSNKELESEISSYVQRFIKKNPFENALPNYEQKQPGIKQTIRFDDSYYRVCAKILFNYLALVKGQQFVLQECFNPLRNWIVNGGENNFAYLTGDSRDLSYIPFPDQAHKLIITQKGKSLIGYITFYGNSFETIVILTNDLEDFFGTDGFICDWKNKQEFRFVDYVNALEEH